MMTSSNGNIFRVTGPLCGEFTGPGEFPTQRPVTRSFDVLFDLCLNKRLSKPSWGWWFETPSRSLWRHRNVERSCSTSSCERELKEWYNLFLQFGTIKQYPGRHFSETDIFAVLLLGRVFPYSSEVFVTLTPWYTLCKNILEMPFESI